MGITNGARTYNYQNQNGSTTLTPRQQRRIRHKGNQLLGGIVLTHSNARRRLKAEAEADAFFGAPRV